jgi:T4 RnlA family RNA ligase
MSGNTDKLYSELMALTTHNNTPFYFVDQVCPHDGETYRIFNYRLASWTEFQLPSALECRGTMFRLVQNFYVDGGFIPVLVSRPFQKFFNKGEGDVDHDIKQILRLENKFDGSLIRTYLDANGIVRFASKGSLTSEHAIAAERIASEWSLSKQEALFDLVDSGNTVCYEYASPDHPIVIRYDKTDLEILAARNNETGEYLNGIHPDNCIYSYENILKAIDECATTTDSNFEGYVAVYMNGIDRFKIKSRSYCRLHHLKDDINNVSKIIELSLDEKIDDVIAAFAFDEAVKQRLIDVNHWTLFYYRIYMEKFDELKNYFSMCGWSRKDIAIHCQAYHQQFFHAIMAHLSGKDFDHKKKFKESFTDIIENLIGKEA